MVDNMIESSSILPKGEKPDHTVSSLAYNIENVSIFLLSQVMIKYVSFVGNNKRAMDEYTLEIYMDGHNNSIVIHNTC